MLTLAPAYRMHVCMLVSAYKGYVCIWVCYPYVLPVYKRIATTRVTTECIVRLLSDSNTHYSVNLSLSSISSKWACVKHN